MNVPIGNVSNAQHLFTSKKMLKPKATKLNITLFKLRLNPIKDCFMQVTCWKKYWRCKGKTFSYSLLSKSHWMVSEKTFLGEDADSSDWIHVTQWRHPGQGLQQQQATSCFSGWSFKHLYLLLCHFLWETMGPLLIVLLWDHG